MNDDYLWDRSGQPDPEVENLERLLGRYQHRDARPPVQHRKPRLRSMLAIAATILAIAGAVAMALFVRFQWSSGTPWEIVAVSGSATIDGRPIDSSARLGVGSNLQTEANSFVTIRVARIGELDVGPGSDLTLVATAKRRHRLALRSGSVSARVWAPPFVFGIDTPAGLASDIGCAFELAYQGNEGVLRVTSGWVDFDGTERSTLVPAGAVAELRSLSGPGSPYFPDASAEFRDGLRRYDLTGDRAALVSVLRHAREQDVVTLIHLLERAPRPDGELVFDRLARLAPPPSGVTREGALNRDFAMLDQWRRALGLGGVKKWWRQWRDAL